MRIFLLSFLIIFNILNAFAQRPEQIRGYAKVSMPVEWYKKQAAAWEKEVDKDPKNVNAWFNYYKATRILIFHDETDKSTMKEKDARLEGVVADMGKEIPNTYEYNFARWQLGGNDMKFYPYLQKAIDIDPNREESIEYMVNIGELIRDQKQRDEYSLKNFDIGQISTGMMYYNYNQLIGLEKNAILLTSGDNDTYPSWVLQAKGIRKDVKVINLYLIHIKDYRKKIFSELGIKNVDFDENSKEEKHAFDKKIVQLMSENKNNYPVYVALTSAGCDNYTTNIEKNLYLTGLAYMYDTNSIDNIALLKRNFESRYTLDYFDKNFYTEMSPGIVKQANLNYIVPMVKLYEHYKSAGDIQKQNWIKEKLILIASGTDSEETVLKYID